MRETTQNAPAHLRLEALFAGKQQTVFFNHLLALLFLTEIYRLNQKAALIWYSVFFVTVMLRHLAVANYKFKWLNRGPSTCENIYAAVTSLNFFSWGLAYWFYSQTDDPTTSHLISIVTWGLLFGGLATNFASRKTSYGVLVLIISCIIYFELSLNSQNYRIIIALLGFSFIMKTLIDTGHHTTIKSLLLANESKELMLEQNKSIQLQKELAEQKQRDMYNDLKLTGAVQGLLFPPSSTFKLDSWTITGTCITAATSSPPTQRWTLRPSRVGNPGRCPMASSG